MRWLPVMAWIFMIALASADARTVLRFILVDEGVTDPSFVSFRSELLNAVTRHDKTFVKKILAPDISWTIDGNTNSEMFLQQWQDLSDASPFWPRLKKALTHGAQRDTNEFTFPAVSFADNHSDKPQAVVWTENAALHKEASEDSTIIRPIFDEQVSILKPADKEPLTSAWVKILTTDGLEGYLQAKDLFSAYDDFAVFKKTDGAWQLKWFGHASGL